MHSSKRLPVWVSIETDFIRHQLPQMSNLRTGIVESIYRFRFIRGGITYFDDYNAQPHAFTSGGGADIVGITLSAFICNVWLPTAGVATTFKEVRVRFAMLFMFVQGVLVVWFAWLSRSQSVVWFLTGNESISIRFGIRLWCDLSWGIWGTSQVSSQDRVYFVDSVWHSPDNVT